MKRMIGLLLAPFILVFASVAFAGAASKFVPSTSVLSAVAKSQHLNRLPSNLENALKKLAESAPNEIDWGGDIGRVSSCKVLGNLESTQNYRKCTFGDRGASQTVALIGDSRAEMFLDDFDALGKEFHFRVILVMKEACGIANLPYSNNSISGSTLWTACVKFHQTMLQQVAAFHPTLTVISSNVQDDVIAPGSSHQATPREVTAGTLSFLRQLPSTTRVLVLGGFPQPAPTSNPETCLARYQSAVQRCSFVPAIAVRSDLAAARAAVAATSATYFNLEPYFCGNVCSPVVGDHLVYTTDGYHAGKSYLFYLLGTIWSAVHQLLTR